MDEPVIRARAHCGSQPAHHVFQAVAGTRDAYVTGGGFCEVAERAVEDNLLTRAALGDAAVVDQGDFAEARSLVPLHHIECAGKPCHGQFHAARVLLEQHLQGRAGHVLDHRDVRRVVVPAAISQIDPGRANMKGIQAPVSGLEQIHARGMRKRIRMVAGVIGQPAGQ
jgi:hypothetical protein